MTLIGCIASMCLGGLAFYVLERYVDNKEYILGPSEMVAYSFIAMTIGFIIGRIIS